LYNFHIGGLEEAPDGSCKQVRMSASSTDSTEWGPAPILATALVLFDAFLGWVWPGREDINGAGVVVDLCRCSDSKSCAELTLTISVIPSGISSLKAGAGGNSTTGGNEATDSE
jgi:hypothetical protein